MRSASSSARVWRDIEKIPINAKAIAPHTAVSLTRTTPIVGRSKPKPGPFMALFTATMFGLMSISET